MKTLLAVALALTAFYHVAPAQAALLEVTSGTVVAFEQDSVISIAGDNWSLTSTAPFGAGPSLDSAVIFNPTFIVDGVDLSPAPAFEIYGTLSMILAGTAPSVFIDPFQTTFTMTGFITLGGGFELTGHGTVIVDPPPGGGTRHATYTFLAPEPSTWLLLVVAAALFATPRCRRGTHKRRAV